MKYNDLKSSLKEVLSTQATSYDYEETLDFITAKCYELGASNVEIDQHDNLYVTKGKADVYPCVVSHTDTVHDIYRGYKVYSVKGNFVAYDSDKMQQVGVGGDDKVGIWICLEALRHFDNIKVCFFAQEEIGCVGSSLADADFFSDVGYAFECDRKGNKDFVQESSGVKMFGGKFKSLISPSLKKFGYSITDGGLTDVHEISQDIGIACANMSCGYYNPHSSKEYVNVKDAVNTLDLIKELITTLGENMHKHVAEHTYGGYNYGYKSYGTTIYGTQGGNSWNWDKTAKISEPKEEKKIVNNSKEFEGCDLCGAISTDGCDFCVVDTSSNVNNSEPCSCGGVKREYGAGDSAYKHCYGCGFYEEAKVMF